MIWHYGLVRWMWVAIVGAVLAASCSPGDGAESIPLPTSPNTTSTTSTTTTTTTTTLVPPRYEATIRRTTDGVPHISGATIDDVAYGQGWVNGEDHGCTLSDQVIKVLGRRAATLGPGAEGENVESDFAWRSIDIATIAAADFENVASDEVVAQFEAYTAGWNDQLADGGGEFDNGWCAGAEWVRPLEPVEVYTYARSVALQASSARLVDYIGSAQPPVDEPVGLRRATSSDLSRFEQAVDGLGLNDAASLGSNGWAIGRDRVEGAQGGLLLANPHFPWEGELRFAEAHLTVPGQFDIYGANLLGLPGIGIGFTDGVAWTHTVSAGKRMTGYNLTLDPTSPTSYLVDGAPVPMTATPTTIDILRADGTVDTETRTLWRSEYGPIIDFPGVGWTDSNVLTFRDANIDNNEFIEQYARMPAVQSIDDLVAVTAQYQGVPLFNTVATDSQGNTWYADSAATPNLSAEAEQLYIGKLFGDRHHADRLPTGSRPARRIRQPIPVGSPTRCSRPGPRAIHRTAAGRAQRLRVQRQRQLLGAECRVHADRAVLDHERRAGHGVDDADPTERGSTRRRELDGSRRARRAVQRRRSSYGSIRQLGTDCRAPATVRCRRVPGVGAGGAARPARH